VDVVIANMNIAQVPADLLALKHADGFYGADKAIAQVIGFDDYVQRGQARFCRGIGLAAPEVLFIGVGPLEEFRYERIQEFGAQAIRLARQHHRAVRHLALTIHGPGYGLDPEESFISMIAGIVAEWKRVDGALSRVTIAERSEKRCDLLNNMLQEHLQDLGLAKGDQSGTVKVASQEKLVSEAAASGANIVQFGARAQEKPRLFVAMPFAEEFVDEFEIAFHEAAKASEYICERLDLESFTGDIVTEIKRRIVGSHGVIALLNNHNPNVFLEVGFALAHNKPTILVARDGTKLPFDVSGHRCLLYRSITGLRAALTTEIASLKARGVLVKSA
jgi:hypothetical protein